MSSSENVQTVRELFDAFYAANNDAMSELIGDGFRDARSRRRHRRHAAGWKRWPTS